MRIAQLSNNKKLLTGVAGVAMAAVVGTTVGYQALSHDVTLRLDGKNQSATVMAGTVGEALEDQGITIGEHDVVTPSLGSKISDGSTIDVKYARQLDLTVDGQDSTHWVTSTNVSAALAEIGRDYVRSDISVSRSQPIGRDGLDLEVVTPKSFTLIDGAKKKRTVEVAVATVGEALTELGVAPDADDTVRPSVDTALESGAKVVLTRMRTETKTVTGEKIPFTTTKKDDGDLDKGTNETVTEGKAGARNVTYRLTFRNGKQVDKKVVTSTVTRKPVAEVVKVGTKEPENPAPNMAGGNSVWDRLAACESGGNWSINTGNGFYGGLQFSASTWRAVGGTGLPHQHSREEQIKRGQILQSRAGWGQWPHCTSKLGLR